MVQILSWNRNQNRNRNFSKLRTRTGTITITFKTSEPQPEPEPYLLKSRNRKRNRKKQLRFHNTGWGCKQAGSHMTLMKVTRFLSDNLRRVHYSFEILPGRIKPISKQQCYNEFHNKCQTSGCRTSPSQCFATSLLVG